MCRLDSTGTTLPSQTNVICARTPGSSSTPRARHARARPMPPRHSNVQSYTTHRAPRARRRHAHAVTGAIERANVQTHATAATRSKASCTCNDWSDRARCARHCSQSTGATCASATYVTHANAAFYRRPCTCSDHYPDTCGTHARLTSGCGRTCVSEGRWWDAPSRTPQLG